MYYTTDDLSTALSNNYIGEVVIRLSLIAEAARYALGLPPFHSWVMYYYGKPDAELRKLFRYVVD